MGIIRKQSIYSSIFSYLGFIVGAVNKLLIFPLFFSTTEIGLTTVAVDLGLVFASLATFGSNSVTAKFFPFYKAYLPRKKNDLPAITLFTCIGGCITIILALIFFKGFIIRKFGQNSAMFVTHYHMLYPLVVTIALFLLFEAFAWSIQKTVISNFLREVLFRVVVLVLLLLYIYKVIPLETFFTLYSYIYLPSVIVLLIYLISTGNFRINFSISNVTRRMYKRIASYGALIFSGAMLNVISRTIDVIFLASQSAGGLSDANVFSYGSYMISIMDVPQRSIVAIATPIISQAWKDKNMQQIHELYQKTSLNLLIVGFFIWGVIFLNMHNTIQYLGSAYAPMQWIFVVMGVAKLIDLGTGANSQILLLSKYWRLDFVTNMLFVGMALPLNYTLIHKYGIYGPAYANLIALTIFNSVRFFYIWKLFRLQPFTRNTLYAILIAIVCISAVHFVPVISNLYLDIIIRSTIFVSLFVTGILYFHISEDLTALFQQTLQHFKKK
jgi:O-antigen/teichoic acid export membrane protein